MMPAVAKTLPPPPPGFVPETSVQAPPPPPGFAPEAGQAAGQAGQEEDWLGALLSGLGTAAGAVGSAADQAAQGIADGVLLIGAAPAELINAAPMLGNILPGEQGIGPLSAEPMFGFERMKRTSDQLAVDLNEALGLDAPDLTPDNMGERIIRRTGEEFGAAALPTGVAARQAQAIGREAAKRVKNPLARGALEQAAINPGKFKAAELSAAVAAGTGAGIAQEVSDHWIAELLGAILGVGTTGLVKTAGKKAYHAAQAVKNKGTYIDDTVRREATDILAQNSGIAPGEDGTIDTQSLVDAISGGPRIEETIPGYQASLADRTQNPHLAAFEFSRASPNAGIHAERQTRNTEAVDAAMGEVKPTQQTGAFKEALQERQRDALDTARTAREGAVQADEAAMDALRTQTDRPGRGNTIRGELEPLEEAAEQGVRDAFTNLGLRNYPVPAADVTAALDNITNGLGPVERGLIPEDMIERLAAPGRAQVQAGQPAPQLTLDDAHQLRGDLLRRKRAAISDPNADRGGAAAARIMDRYIAGLETFIGGNLPAAQQSEFRAALQQTYDTKEAFTRQGDPVADVLSRREGGRHRVADHNVADRFTRSGEDIDRLFAQTNTQPVRQALRDALVDRVNTRSPETIRRSLDQYSDQLRRFPQLRQEIEEAAQARVGRTEAEAAETTTVREWGDPSQGRSGRSTAGDFLSYRDPVRAMDNIVLAGRDGPARVEDLLRHVNDPTAVDGLRRAFWDSLERRSRRGGETTMDVRGAQPWMPNKLNELLKDPDISAVAERLWRDNPEHLARIREIAEALRHTDVKSRTRITNQSGTPQGLGSQALSGETVAARSLAWHRGQIGMPFFFLSLGTAFARRSVRFAQKDAIMRAVDKAIDDPEFASFLFEEYNPSNRRAMARKAKMWMGQHGAELIAMADEGSEDEANEEAGVDFSVKDVLFGEDDE